MTSPTSSDAGDRRETTLPFWGAAAVLAVAAAPYAAGFVPPCLFKTWTALPCPLCGTTRAAVALARLDVTGALIRYPLPALAWIAVIGAGLVTGAAALLGRPVPRPRRPPLWAWTTLAVAFLANWIYSIATGV